MDKLGRSGGAGSRQHQRLSCNILHCHHNSHISLSFSLSNCSVLISNINICVINIFGLVEYRVAVVTFHQDWTNIPSFSAIYCDVACKYVSHIEVTSFTMSSFA